MTSLSRAALGALPIWVERPGGSIAPFFTRPMSGALAAITIFSILWSIPGFSARAAGLFRRRSPAPS